jgi:sensor c-di-GMP phosphodiesterase-like protein
VRIAIDDFGTGYSSLERLGTFPIHTLKVAKAFTDSVDVPGHSSAIAFSIIALANSMGLNVIAEGVERKSQVEFLHAHSCSEMQGFLFSPGVPPDAFLELLRSSASRG